VSFAQNDQHRLLMAFSSQLFRVKVCPKKKKIGSPKRLRVKFFKFMVQSEVPTHVKMRKPKATIISLPLEVDIMIIEWLPLKYALNLAKALKLPEQVAVQYFACEEDDLEYKCNIVKQKDLQPSSFKFLLKNKSFQIVAHSYDRTWAAVRTLDLDFVKKYLEQVKPDLDHALYVAAVSGSTDVVKLLLSDSRADPSEQDNLALIGASEEGHLEIVTILLADARVDPSGQDNAALGWASKNGHLEIVKLLLSDDRVDPSARDNAALIFASLDGHLEIVKLLLSDDRVDPSVLDNRALISAALVAHSEGLEKVRHYILTI
jgi:hypothetical protein